MSKDDTRDQENSQRKGGGRFSDKRAPVTIEIKGRRRRDLGTKLTTPTPISSVSEKAPKERAAISTPDERLSSIEQKARLAALETALSGAHKKPRTPLPEPILPPSAFDIEHPPVHERKQVHDTPRDDKDDIEEDTPKKTAKKGVLKKEERLGKRDLEALYVSEAAEENVTETSEALSQQIKQRSAKKSGFTRPVGPKKLCVALPASLTVRELAFLMSEKLSRVLRTTMKMGLSVTANETLDTATAELIVLEMGHTVTHQETEASKLDSLEQAEKDVKDLPTEVRPPIVTVMGHVDHGKTSLLDAMRETNITGKEAGGITQHIGAYQITTQSGKKITFIDTPGHAAFTQMRARGAQSTDIVILLVSADDGVMKQTVEAIEHTKAAGVPMIVAINKIDKPEANPDHVRQGLLAHDIVVESLGGDVQDVCVSAKTKKNLEGLQDAILLQAEMLELKAPVKARAQGVVLEAKQDKKRGLVGSILIQKGTLDVGDIFVAGATWGRVRRITNDRHKNVRQAILSEPVEIMGFDAPPEAGDDFFVTHDESIAKIIAALRTSLRAQPGTQKSGPASLDDLLKRSNQKKELTIILKADTQGSLEAIQMALENIDHPEVAVKVLYKGVGSPSRSDILLAETSEALVINFNVPIPAELELLAEQSSVHMQRYEIIYQLIENVKDLLAGLLAPEKREVVLGHAEIRQVFSVGKTNKIAGCYVTDGLVKRGAFARLKRGEDVRHESSISTLRREKNDVKEVREKFECGICIENYHDFDVGDVIEVFEKEYVKRTLDS